MKSMTIIFFILGITTGCTLLEVGSPQDMRFGISELDIRRMVYISEVHWAGSVDENGNRSNPDDDFIEIANGHKGVIDIGGWTIVVLAQNHQTIQIPDGTVLYVEERYSIGNNTNGAFTFFNQIEPNLKLGNAGFSITIYDGGGQKSSDSLDFLNYGAPAGYDLLWVKKSMIRVCDYFGALPANLNQNWLSYHSSQTANIRENYILSIYASPSSELGSINSGGSGDD